MIRIFPFIFLLLFSTSYDLLAEVIGVNIARGKKYTLEPAPNYKYSSDADDKIQLTDGYYFKKRRFWTQKTTVGWGNVNPVTIIIDLGSISPISGLSYNTAAGAAEVNWPRAILIFVSNDSNNYFYTGDLIELSQKHGLPKSDKYGVHRFWTDQLSTHGRYVKLLVIPVGPYTFVDEIEIYQGSPRLLQKPIQGKKNIEIKSFVKSHVLAKAVRRRLEDDIRAVRELLKGLDNRIELKNKITSIQLQTAKIRSVNPDGFTTVFPINDLHRQVFEVQASAWRAKGFNNITLWQKNRWDMLSPTEIPSSKSPKIDVKMMRNEYRSAAFNISNAGKDVAEIDINIEGLQIGMNPELVTVHAGLFTDTHKGIPIMSALPLAEPNENGFLVKIDPGLTRQVWLTFYSKGVEPGEYRGKINIEPGAFRIPVTLKVYPFIFPDQPTLHLGGWDYTNAKRLYDVTPENRSALIQLLKEYFVDTPWATSTVLQRGKYDKSGNMIEKPDTRNFATWIQRWPKARNYNIFVNVNEKFGGFKMGTPPFERAVANWISFWVNRLKEWGIEAQQLGLLLVDEPNTIEESRIVIQYASIIKDVQPKVVIWEDVAWREPWKAPKDLFNLSDVLCVHLPTWNKLGSRFTDFYLSQQKNGRELWFYSASGSTKLLDPYSYYRIQQWHGWKYGAKGSCFWAFGDARGASSWNEYLAKSGGYTPIFLGPKTVTASKHMEAIREGVEDYEYLLILRNRIEELEKSHKDSDAIEFAKTLLSSAVHRVTKDITDVADLKWTSQKDRMVADNVREEILDILFSLKNL